MNLLELIDIRIAYRSTLNNLILKLNNNLSGTTEVFDTLNEIEETLDLLLLFERTINKEYHNSYLSETESIADVYTYIDGLSEKIGILDNLILLVKSKDTLNECKFSLDYKHVAQSTERYKILRSSLLERVKDKCKKINVKGLKL